MQASDSEIENHCRMEVKCIVGGRSNVTRLEESNPSFYTSLYHIVQKQEKMKEVG